MFRYNDYNYHSLTCVYFFTVYKKSAQDNEKIMTQDCCNNMCKVPNIVVATYIFKHFIFILQQPVR